MDSVFRLRISFFLAALTGIAVVLQADPAKGTETHGINLQTLMPEAADQVHLAWVNGPPQLQAFLPEDKHLAGFRDANASLGIRSGRWGMVIDPRKLSIPYITFEDSNDPAEELLGYDALQRVWDLASLSLTVDYRETLYRAEAGPIPSYEPHHKYSPIHIIESGLWYQHIAIYDLVLRAPSGETLDAESWIELRAWGDQLLIEWFVQPQVRGFTKLILEFESEANDLSRTVRSMANSVQLRLTADDRLSSTLPDQAGVSITAKSRNDFDLGEPEVVYSTVADAWELQFSKQRWPKTPAAYPEECLDRVSSYELNLKNDSDEVKEVRLRMIHDYHPITGFVPMLVDKEGHQTGIPFQNSKNWHVFPSEFFPYEGTWINQTTRLTLAPRSEVDLRYEVVHALWQGLPASSASQLSLAGWGFNGFWTQMALGAWGETVCIQPGRTMRRAFITDVRPFMVRSMNDLSYDWTTNMGGADLLKIIDAAGRYIPWLGSITDYRMIGPNLSHVAVNERTPDDRLRVEIDTYLPISDSISRVYFNVRMEVLEDIDVREVVLFQLGSDYYNDAKSTKVAWGVGEDVHQELQPTLAQRGPLAEAVELVGDNSWFSLFGNISTQKNVGQAVRGVIVRDFDAFIGGQQDSSPWVRPNSTGKALGAELLLSPEHKQLRAGDTVEFLLEFVILPLSAESYLGDDEALRLRIAESPDSWEPLAHEAVFQHVLVNEQVMGYPVTLAAEDIFGKQFTVNASGSLATIAISGLPDAGATWRLKELVDGDQMELGTRYLVEANPQISYDIQTKSWTVVFTVSGSLEGAQRHFFLEHISN